MTNRVHAQLIAVDFHNSANNQLLWELTGDPMERHCAGARWVEQTVAAHHWSVTWTLGAVTRRRGLSDGHHRSTGHVIGPCLGGQ